MDPDTTRDAFLNLYVSNEEFIQIQNICSKYKVTPFIFFLCIYLLLIHHISSEERILLAIPLDKRDSDHLQKIIGLISDVVPSVFSINREIKFSKFLANIKTQFFETLNFSNIPIELIHDDLKFENQCDLQDYFRMMVVYNDYSDLKLSLEGVKSEFIESFCGARSDFLFAITKKEKNIAIRFEYKQKYFSPEYIRNLSNRFHFLMSQVIESHDVLLSDYNIILPEEEILLSQYEKGSSTDLSFKGNIVEIFDTQADATPNAIALVDQDIEYSFKELQRKSRNVARYLQQNSIKKGDVIGVMLNRSVDVYICLIAILRVGCIYLPIPTNLPTSRVSYMLDKVVAKLLITKLHFGQQHKIENHNISLLENILSLNLDNYSDKYSNTFSKASYSDNCYILFTSGSTGDPKAVLGSHDGLLNRLCWGWRQFPISKDDICCHITNIGFIDSLTEMLTPLLKGAKQVIISDEVTHDGELFVESLITYKVTRLTTVPSLLRFFAIAFKKESQKLYFLRLIVTSGEEIDISTVRQYKTILPSTRIVNFYGSTEVNGDATFYEINSDIDYEKYIPIGKPVDNAYIYILNKYNKRVPIGFKGEICVAGRAVNNGYLSGIDLNTKFIKNPFQNGMIYKTGDYGSFLDDGNIRFLGRNNDVIKVFGHRVGIVEIKNAILNISGVVDVYIKYNFTDSLAELKAYIEINESTFYSNHEKSESSLYIRSELSKSLPFYMIPSEYFLLDKFPKLVNGKLDVRFLVTLDGNKPYETNFSKQSTYSEIISQNLEKVLGIKNIDIKTNFFDLGVNSLLLVKLYQDLIKCLPNNVSKKLNIVDLFTYSNTQKLSEYCDFLDDKSGLNIQNNNIQNKLEYSGDIAIIGFSCRFPGATNQEEFWENIKNGVESIKFFEDSNNIEENHKKNRKHLKQKIYANALLEDTEYFDNQFFGYTDSEARLMDPQHRIFLQECYKALENSGYISEKYNGSIGIFAGSGDSRYFINNILLNNKLSSTSSFNIDFWAASQLNSTQFLSTKVAYKLDNKGPVVNITTACSTSLVAVGMACESLRRHQGDIILAGGVSLVLPDEDFFEYQDGSILSRDGHCRPFSSDSNGTIMGSGAGVVVLKRLEDAIKDNDSIHAVIKGVGINNDGSHKISFSAPSVEGQLECIKKALKDGGISAETISYVETHGTGTRLGDPIEVTALTKAFASDTDKKNYCGIGSVKANIGHANIASGIASLIKVILCLKYKRLVPLVNFNTINPNIDINNSPFYVCTKAEEWVSNIENLPLRASVNSLGIGGTNAHLVLEEWKGIEKNENNIEQSNIFCFSAKSITSLRAILSNFRIFLDRKKEEKLSVSDIAFTLAKGRRDLEFRTGFICKNIDDAIFNLEKALDISITTSASTKNLVLILSNNELSHEFVEILYRDQKFFSNILDESLISLENNNISSFNGRFSYKTQSDKKLLSLAIKYSFLKFLISLGLDPKFILFHGQTELLFKYILAGLPFDEILKCNLFGEQETKSVSDVYIKFDNHSLSEVMNNLRQRYSSESLIFIDVFSYFQNESEEFYKKGSIYNFFQDKQKSDNKLDCFYNFLLQIWKLGFPLKLDILSKSNHRIALPSYPFQKIKHWIDREYINKSEKNVSSEPSDSSVENSLLEIWKEVFESDEINITENFYDLGGHSLTALQIVSRINEKLSIEIDISEILKGINIKELSDIITLREQKLNIGNQNSALEKKSLALTSELSEAQKRVWMLDHLYPDSGICNVPIAFRVKGKIDINILSKAFLYLVEKHSILRSNIILSAGIIKQQIVENCNVDIETISLNEEQSLEDIFNKYILKNFKLEVAPLFRVILIDTLKNEQVLLLVFHHIIIDSWSAGIFINDLSSLYKSLANNSKVENRQLKQNYIDFVNKQKFSLEQGNLEKEEQYWKLKLESLNQNYFFNQKYELDATKKHDAHNYLFTVDKICTDKIRRFARDNNVTIYTVLLSVYKYLISMYSGSKDIAVISPFANRQTKDFEDVIGLFSNFLILRSNICGIKNFKDIVSIVKEEILEAYKNSKLPFEVVLSSNNIDISSYFMFVMHEEKITTNKVFNTEIIERFNLFPTTIPGPMSLEVILRSNNLILNFIYSENILGDETAQLFAKNYIELLDKLISYPDKLISEVNFGQQQNIEFLDNDLTYPLDQNLYELFYNISYKKPEGTIIITNSGERYSYSTLSARINEITSTLISSGVKENNIIGVYLDPSIDLIASILAILKLNAIYLPLDFDYPAKRIQYYIDDSKAEFVITSTTNPLASSLRVKNLIIIDEKTTYDLSPVTNYFAIKNKRGIACIIYTSGSTGDPKGVMISHSSIINRCYWFKKNSIIDKKEIFCLSTTINFVDSLAEIFSPLILEQKLYIPSKQGVYNINGFLEEISRNRVTHLVVVPSLLKLILENTNVKDYLVNLRRVICSGDILSRDIASKFISLFPNVKLYNYYGSTEVTADATYFEVKESNLKISEDISIGKEISNTKVVILNEQLELLPTGIPGTIYISGKCLSKGYLNDPELTNGKFIQYLIKEENYWFFNTGDKGYKSKDGNIFYLGRKDSIININGNRINLLEIERALDRIVYIKDRVVQCISFAGSSLIVAFIVLSEEERKKSSQIIKYNLTNSLSQNLPRYMLPNIYKFLEFMPHTQSGKIDKVQLKKMDITEEHSIDKESNISDDPTEKHIQELFNKELNVQNSSIYDNFFLLGGTSISLVKIIAQVEDYFNIKVKISDIFTNPTVYNFVKIICSSRINENSVDFIFKISGDKNYKKSVILFHPISGFSYEYIGLKKYFSNHNAYCINYPYLRSDINKLDSIESMIECYLSNISHILEESESITFIGYSFGGILAIEAAKYLNRLDKKISKIILIDTYFPTEIIKEKSLIEKEIDRNIQTMRFDDFGISKGHVVDVININYKLLQKYKIPKLDNQVYLLRTVCYPKKYEELWKENIFYKFNLIEIPGSHYTLMKGENASVLGDEISKLLNN